jgi:3-hydroxyisobutyrate dehydrogenase-like beta-hydroxyacid dehydrogenase
MDIAFLGLGGMGSGMARSLMKHGHKVTVWNRSSEPAEAIHEQGAQVAATPAEAARHAEIAITMLADDRAVESVVLGESGLAEGLPKDAVHVSMSTISVALSERLDLAHAERGQQFVAAPVFGRPDRQRAASSSSPRPVLATLSSGSAQHWMRWDNELLSLAKRPRRPTC